MSFGCRTNIPCCMFAGVEIANSAMQKVYAGVPPEKWLFVSVAVAPSTITITEHGVRLTSNKKTLTQFNSISRFPVYKKILLL